MLVLSRKTAESIRIGEDIEVVVLEVTRSRVRLGFRCPQHVDIARGELVDFEELEIPVRDRSGDPPPQRKLASA